MSLGTETIIFDSLTSDPTSPDAGEIWYNSSDNRWRWFDGSTTHEFASLAELTAHVSDTGNPHNTTLEQARTAGDTFAGNVNMGGNRLENVGDAAAVTDAPNLQQVRDEIRQFADGLDWQESVLDKDLVSPPGSPAIGDRYLIFGAGTGAWTGLDDNIVEWDGSSWIAIPPDEGFTVPVEDEGNTQYRYTSGVWSSVMSTTDHGALSGLTDDDHPQYLLVNGSRPMTGPLDMGGQNITNVGTVDGVDVSGHAARHITGGADEIDGDQLDVDFSPSNYTPSTAPPEVSDADHLSAHLAGIDDALGAVGSTRKAGRVLAGAFGGTPLQATVAFNTAYASADYVVQLTPVTTGRGYNVRVLNKTVSGFTIRLGSNNSGPLVSVDWATDVAANP